MKIAMLGTGQVAHMLANKLVSLGHQVRMGAREATNEKAAAWAAEVGEAGSPGPVADAAAFGELTINCTAGQHTLTALEMAGAPNLAGKTLLDVANPLDFSQGFPPRLSVCNDDSLGEQVQRAFPDAKVVKSLNTMANPIMVDPDRIGGETDVFVCGDDEGAKGQVIELLQSFGWPAPIDMGGIDAARGLEAWLLWWTRLWKAFGTADFNIKIVRS